MDLVEQLYGDISLHDDLPTEEAEEPEIQNKQVDEQAWNREGSHRDTASVPHTPVKNGTVKLFSTPSTATVSSSPARPAISLDDYAERMRMAAVMLAQLDASQQASKGVVATGTAAAGTLVGLPVATVAGIGGAVGAGLGAVASRLGRGKDTPPGINDRDTPPPAGQGATGTTVSLDTTSAAEGTSAVSGQGPVPGVATPTGTPVHHRPRLLTSQEAAMIRERIMSEMMALEEERMARMREDGRARRLRSGTEDGSVVMRAVNKDDPSGE
jgi:phosphatidylinositol 4-kinase